ncbi:MAG: AAA family ATPase [Methylococcales bacterium]|nr:AAA family ATPase [Methylococcales bacterium]
MLALNSPDILVYNQKFIQDCFYESNEIKGIFTLSKENKEAEENIRNYHNKIENIKKEKIDKDESNN